MTTRGPALCWACERRDIHSTVARCQAFPDQIPFEIITLSGDHHESVDGDHGLQFVQADTDAARIAYVDWKAFNDVRG